MQSCRTGGNVYLIGALSRKPVQFPAGLLITGNCRLIGLTVGSQAHQQEMVRAVEAHQLKPVVDRVFAIADLGQAFRCQEAKARFGKICIEIRIALSRCHFLSMSSIVLQAQSSIDPCSQDPTE